MWSRLFRVLEMIALNVDCVVGRCPTASIKSRGPGNRPGENRSTCWSRPVKYRLVINLSTARAPPRSRRPADTACACRRGPRIELDKDGYLHASIPQSHNYVPV